MSLHLSTSCALCCRLARSAPRAVTNAPLRCIWLKHSSTDCLDHSCPLVVCAPEWRKRPRPQLGCIRVGAGEITHWFSSALSDDEIGVLGAARGACELQQVLEALFALATRRAWSSHEQSERHPVGVRSDSVSALVWSCICARQEERATLTRERWHSNWLPAVTILWKCSTSQESRTQFVMRFQGSS